MKKCYLGIDAGNYSFKGVIIDSKKNIIGSSNINMNRITDSLKNLLIDLSKKIDFNKYKLMGIGVTGSYRRIVGLLLETDVIRNEIISHYVGAINYYKDVDNIIDLGKNNIKLINNCNGKIGGYSIDQIDLNNKYEVDRYFENRCLNNVMLLGGNSKNREVVNIIKKYVSSIYLCDNSDLMGAIGVALIVISNGIEKEYDINISDIRYDIKEISCEKCRGKCNIICLCRDNRILDYRGNKCNRIFNKINV